MNQPVIIDLCDSSSSSDDDDDHDNDEHDILQPVTATTTSATTAKTTTTRTAIGSSNGKRARMAAAAEARMLEHEPPRKQQRRRPETTSTTTTSKPSAACMATRKPPPGAVAAGIGVATLYESVEQPEPLVFLKSHARDDAIVTTGIGHELAKLHPNVLRGVATCCSCSAVVAATAAAAGSGDPTLLTRLPSLRRCRRPLTLHHVQQPDQWSCGFRNLQMLLLALVPQLQHNHAYFDFHPEQNGAAGKGAAAEAFAIPCLQDIEEALEAAWATGLDDKGREHYHGKIRGKRAWVGAVEIWSVLTYWSLDACVVQFIKTPTSRRQLGPFLYAYFTKRQEYNQQHDDDNIDTTCMFCSQQRQQQQEGHCSNMPPTTTTTQAMAAKLLTIASSRNHQQPRRRHDGNGGSSSGDGGCCCSCPVLPVYLQWKGHSVTVIGVELSCPPNQSSSNKTSTNGKTTALAQQPREAIMERPINLIVLDPSKNGPDIKSSLAQGNLTKLRLPLHRLESQDVQVILPSTRNITQAERLARKVHINAVTAV